MQTFYHRFIRKVAAPLTRLTSTSQPFAWTAKAEATFSRLKVLFTTAPVLTQPDTARQLTVEVDSDVGVGVVLSQRSGMDQRLHPCAFFSRHFERNYDVGNHEFLALVLPLQV